ncbi:MAG: hypothetical protein EBU93_04325 [Chlamydiae bacterium]|nr:hypothetical protein [Chlamydiota bacterium]
MLFVDNEATFTEVIDDLRGQEIIGVDTEFVRKNTYFAQLSLIQISTPTKIYIIDPHLLKIEKLSPIFLSKTIIKIFHACSQDVKIFHNILNIATNHIFDTQEAINFLGIKNQISYQDACLKILARPIDKEQQYRDWNVRPLPYNMIEYAAQDVEHLIELYKTLREMMIQKKIFVNFCKFMESFSSEEFYKIKFDDLWKKVRTNETNPKYLKKLQMLATFREYCAIELNIPRARVISDQDLNSITAYLPSNFSDLKRLNIQLGNIKPSMMTKLFDLCAGIKEMGNR